MKTVFALRSHFVTLFVALAVHALADDFERAPINYSQSTPDNAVSRLQARLEAGETPLEREGRVGYPCSYLIYSASFDALPVEARDYVLGRIRDVLTGVDQDPKFAHLSAVDRAAILKILLDTKPNLPDWWRDAPAAR